MKVEINRKKCYNEENEVKEVVDVDTNKESVECTIKKCLKEGEAEVQESSQLTVLFL